MPKLRVILVVLVLLDAVENPKSIVDILRSIGEALNHRLVESGFIESGSIETQTSSILPVCRRDSAMSVVAPLGLEATLAGNTENLVILLRLILDVVIGIRLVEALSSPKSIGGYIEDHPRNTVVVAQHRFAVTGKFGLCLKTTVAGNTENHIGLLSLVLSVVETNSGIKGGKNSVKLPSSSLGKYVGNSIAMVVCGTVTREVALVLKAMVIGKTANGLSSVSLRRCLALFSWFSKLCFVPKVRSQR
jgi:hypothetical protein